jgi:hypothetical protein
MPIVGLTHNEDGTPREAKWPCLGILRKGAEKTDPKKPGADLQYFRFTSDDHPDAVAKMAQVFGDQPREVRGQLINETTDECFESWRESWSAATLLHRCDGVTCQRWFDAATGKYSQEPVPCPDLGHQGERDRCKQIGRMRLVIPELLEAGLVGYVMLQTTSINDIVNVTKQLRALEAANGSLSGIPVTVRRIKDNISTPGFNGNKRQRVDKYLLQVSAQPNWVRAQLEAQQRKAFASLGVSHEMPALMAPADDEDDNDTPEAHHAPPTTHHAPEPTHDANGVPIRKCEKCHAAMPHGLMKKSGKWGWVCTTKGCESKAFDLVSNETRTALMATATERGLDTSPRSKANRLAQTKALLGRDVASWSDLSPREASKLIDMINDGTFDWEAAPKEPAKPKTLSEAVTETAATAAVDPTPDETEELFGQGGADYVPPAEEVAEGEVVEEAPQAVEPPDHIKDLIVEAGAKGLNTSGILENAKVVEVINDYLREAKQNKYCIAELIGLKPAAAGLVQSAIVRGKLTW